MQPKTIKWRKPHKVPYYGPAKRGTKVNFGEFGLIAKEGNWVSEKQIEAARQAITRSIKRGGKVWIRIFPHVAMTKKPLEVRMGSGKGNLEGFVAVVKEKMVMFEIAGIPEAEAKEALRLGSHKLPMKCKFVRRGEENA